MTMALWSYLALAHGTKPAGPLSPSDDCSTGDDWRANRDGQTCQTVARVLLGSMLRSEQCNDGPYRQLALNRTRRHVGIAAPPRDCSNRPFQCPNPCMAPSRTASARCYVAGQLCMSLIFGLVFVTLSRFGPSYLRGQSTMNLRRRSRQASELSFTKYARRKWNASKEMALN